MFCCVGVDILGSFSRYVEMGVMAVLCVLPYMLRERK